jgi:hypothetical protein
VNSLMPQTQNEINPILADLTVSFNPIFEEMLGWMEEVEVLSAELKTMSVTDKRREVLESRLEWCLTKIGVKANATVEQMYELMPE